MDRPEIIASRASGKADFPPLRGKQLLGIKMIKMVTTDRSLMHLQKASQLPGQ